MPYPDNKEFKDLLNLVEAALDRELPFAIYREPKRNEVVAIFQADETLQLALQLDEKGFVFAPFDWQDNAILIKADKVHTSTFKPANSSLTAIQNVSESGKQTHLDLVQKGVSTIRQGDLQKVVLSRKMEIQSQPSARVIFQRLLEHYSNAFCYWVYHPKIGNWCGATPETLVQIMGGTFKTMSLAATLAFRDGHKPNWGSKEIEEQEMVSKYILGQLSHIAQPLEMSKVESVKAGNLWHLKSEITGRLVDGASAKDVVKALHPTPAVCGIPTQKAKQFILEHEGYQRSYYTGFLGALNLTEEPSASLYVNLRCMEIKEGKATVFVGGGITAASEPEKEWIETQNKSKTMLNILQIGVD